MVINNYFAANSDDIFIYITIRKNDIETSDKTWSKIFQSYIDGNKQDLVDNYTSILLNPEILDSIPNLESLSNNEDFKVIKIPLSNQEIVTGSGEINLYGIIPTEFLESTDQYLIQIYFGDNSNIYSLPSNVYNWNIDITPMTFPTLPTTPTPTPSI